MCIKVSILGSEFVLELQYQFLHLKEIISDMISDMTSGMISYLLNVLIFDLTIFIQVLRQCSTYSTWILCRGMGQRHQFDPTHCEDKCT
jgi:hypothetical protein